MEIEKNNNKELVPLEHYLEEYAKASPEEMSSRTGFPYDTEKQQFQVTFFGRKYVVTWPEFSATTYREVPWGELYYRQFNGRCMMRLAYGFGNRLDSFRKAMEAMHAQPVKAGDAAYQVEVFPGYYVQFLLWEGDEEFAPSSQILFSDNFPAGFHAEDLVVVCDVLITILKNLQ